LDSSVVDYASSLNWKIAMTDIIDQASFQEEMARAAALANARNKKPLLTPHCICYNCAEPIAIDYLFCDVDCRDDWQKRTNAK
jgi:hypothetical protein